MASNEELKGIQKAAILLIALGPEKSSLIFKHLKEEEIKVHSRGRHRLCQGAFGEGAWRRQGDGRHRKADCIFAGKTVRVRQKDRRVTAFELYTG